MTRAGSSDRKSGQRGQAVIEFALVTPLLLILVFAIIDFGWAMGDKVDLTNGARAGARTAVTGRSLADIRSSVQNRVGHGIITDPASQVQVQYHMNSQHCAQGNTTLLPGDTVTVTVSYNYDPLTPLGAFINSTVLNNATITASSQMRLEQVSVNAEPQPCQ